VLRKQWIDACLSQVTILIFINRHRDVIVHVENSITHLALFR
jgi:hypothetical protein